MNRLKYFMIPLVSCMLLLTVGCEDDPPIENPEELITTVNFTLTNSSGGDIILSFSDPDGDGGMNPVIAGGSLSPNTSYSASIELLNESVTPAEDITAEVLLEAEEHQVFYLTDSLNVSFSYTDSDIDLNPIGISTMVMTGDSSSGNITVILRHEPDKFATGVSDGDISNAGGETDIEVSFPVTIQ
ncbi:MAG: type 1 periplasmic binding fold superfamily protein [Chitinophagales bacterium]|nr:type 1 periplasmic binding fold superfamily protein [Chitinophagales bacterium]